MNDESILPPKTWFTRVDESPDELFYSSPRFAEHIDKATISNLSDFYKETISEDSAVLDLMSSWISHLPNDLMLSRVSGLGMNDEELSANDKLTDWCIHNLNNEPELPYKANSFNYVLCAVSIQYLTSPIEVFQSVKAVLKDQGQVIIAMSHRLFPTKAVSVFQNINREDRVRLVMSYLELSGFEEISFFDRSPKDADPLWIVTGQNNRI